MLPRTPEEAADLLIGDLPLAERVQLAQMNEDIIDTMEAMVGETIVTEFGLRGGNSELLEACMQACRTDADETPERLILRRVWENLRQTHRLRRIK